MILPMLLWSYRVFSGLMLTRSSWLPEFKEFNLSILSANLLLKVAEVSALKMLHLLKQCKLNCHFLYYLSWKCKYKCWKSATASTIRESCKTTTSAKNTPTCSPPNGSYNKGGTRGEQGGGDQGQVRSDEEGWGGQGGRWSGRARLGHCQTYLKEKQTRWVHESIQEHKQ